MDQHLEDLHQHATNHLTINGCTYVEQHKENGSKLAALSRPNLASQTSKTYASNEPSERAPMIDISNKLHALVDKFVSNLSSEYDSLANNISAQAHINFALHSEPESNTAPRPSNRTATEVLNGLKRSSEVHVMENTHRKGKPAMAQAKAPVKEGTKLRRDGGKSSQSYELLSSDHSSDDYRTPAT